jgi:four helix bundle protein
MRDPKKLLVLQQSRALAVSIHQLTADFPSSERFGLTAQIRRCAIAVGSNIAEGCGRQGNREFLHSLYVARGEASELGFQVDLAEDLGFAAPDASKAVLDGIDHLQRMLNRLTASVKTRSAKAKGANSDLRAPSETGSSG